MKHKVILDTDLGGDIDDAIALYLLLANPEVEILGISSVYLGNAWRRDLIREILDVFERDVPVCMGAEKPLLGQWTNESLRPQKPEVKSQEAEGDDLTAAAMIIDQCERHPDAVILAIGPLTNLAVALSEAPWIAEQHEAYIMGGDPLSGRPEWNMLCDPEAAKIVLESGMKIHLTGLNCTNRCQFSEDDVRRVLATDSPKGRLMARHLRSFLERFDWLPILHDPLAIAPLLKEGFLRFEPHRIGVETRGTLTRGTTVDLSYDETSPIQLAAEVDAEAFTAYVCDQLCAL